MFFGAYSSHCNLSEFYLDYSRLSRNFIQIREEYLSTIAPSAISPPISKLEAIHIALEQDGWNKITLEGMLVNGKLCYVELTTIPNEKGFLLLYQVMELASDHSPVSINGVNHRYVWYLIVFQQGFSKSIPPPESYLIDAATGEVIMFPF